MRLLQVPRAALGEVDVRVSSDADRHARLAHEGRVGKLLTAEDDERLAGLAHQAQLALEDLR